MYIISIGLPPEERPTNPTRVPGMRVGATKADRADSARAIGVAQTPKLAPCTIRMNVG